MPDEKFIPKVLLCGDKAEFFAAIGQRPCKFVGEIKFSGEVNEQEFNFTADGKFLLNGELHNYQELAPLLQGGGVLTTLFLPI